MRVGPGHGAIGEVRERDDLPERDVPGAVGEWLVAGVQARAMGDFVPLATGREVALNGVTIIEVEGGRIRRAADYLDTAPLVLQLGGRIELPGGRVLTLDEPR